MDDVSFQNVCFAHGEIGLIRIPPDATGIVLSRLNLKKNFFNHLMKGEHYV